MLDLIIKRCTLPDGRQDIDIGIAQGRIAALEPALKAEAARTIDAAGQLVSPPRGRALPHGLDAVLRAAAREPVGHAARRHRAVGELKPLLTQEALVERALAYCDWAVARGLLAIRSHVDVCDPRLLAVEALLHVREQVKPYLDLQLVAFPQDGCAPRRDGQPQARAGHGRGRGRRHSAFRAHHAGRRGIGALLCELAAERGLRVDMHCDESDDPLSRHIETLAYHAQRLGLQGRVTGSHLTSMHSMDNYYVSKLIPLMREAGVSAIANPLINITLQGRHDSYPKRRGMTRVPELLAAGVPVAFGHDCVMDPWYSLGSGDMLEVAHMGLHVAQMTGQDAMRACFEAVTTTPARILGLDDTGLAVGKRADLVLLQARDAVEALRLRATRLMVLRGGEVIAETPPATATLHLPGRPAQVSFQTPAR